MNKLPFFQFRKLKNKKEIKHGVFDKTFGNTSFYRGEKKNVVSAREKIASTLNFNLNSLFEMNQVHSSRVVSLNTESFKKIKNNMLQNCDSLVTGKKGIFLLIKTGDCFPLVFFDPKRKVIGVAHVGWRGAIEKVFVNTLFKLVNEYHCSVSNIIVGIGPGIRKCCFRHKNLIQEKLPEWDKFIHEKNKQKICDIPAFIKEKLKECGVKDYNMEDCQICTVCNKNYFSHFRALRLKEKEGRFATIIGLKK